MGAPLLRVNGRDLSPYLVVGHDEGLEPVDAERISPEFAGSMALREGEGYVGESVGNREWTVPLILSATSRSALHQLAQDIQNDLVNGGQVEFAVDSATDNSTFFLLERGRLDVEFQYFLAVHLTSRATLKLWTTPHGSPAGVRSVASFTGSGPQSFLATGLLGDRPALGRVVARVGSQTASAGRVIGYALHRSPSFNPILTPSLARVDPQTAASVFTSATGIASTYLGIAVSPTGASGVAARWYLDPPVAHTGRHRAIGIVRSRLDRGMSIYAQDRFGAVMGPTVIASQTDANKWQLADLGEISVDAPASGLNDTATQFIDLHAGGASGASVVASYALNVAGVFLMNLDNSPGLLRTPGAGGGNTQLYTDSFDRLSYGRALALSPLADSGQSWVALAGGLGAAYGTLGESRLQNKLGVGTYYAAANIRSAANASGLAALASGAFNQDLYAEVHFGIQPEAGQNASAGASGQIWELWPKAQTNASTITDGVGIRFSIPSGMPALSIWIASGGATALLASTVASSLAPNIWGGADYKMALQVQGPTAQAFLATGVLGAANITTNSVVAQIPGWVAVKNNNAGIASVYPYMDSLNVQSLAGAASDIGPRQWFRFESYPDEQVHQGPLTGFIQNQIVNFRGVPGVHLPVTGSPGASGPVRVLVFEGEVDNFQCADCIDVRIDALERFQFLR